MSQPIDVANKIPVRLGESSEVGGRVTITRRKFGRVTGFILGNFGISPYLRITLDEIGTVAWNAMDGRPVADVLATLETAFPEQENLDARLGQYLQQLVRAKLLRFD